MRESDVLLRPARLLTALLCLLAAVPAALAARAPDTQRALDGKVSSTVHTVRIDHHFGPVTVTGVDRDFGWRWTLDCSGDKARAEAFMKESSFESSEVNGVLQLRFVPAQRDSIRTGRSRNTTTWRVFGFSWTTGDDGVGVESRLELRLPREIAVELKNKFGPVSAGGLRGRLDVDCQNSSVDITDIDGAVTAATSFARLHVERTGPAQLRTQNGEIRARQIGGDLRATALFAKMLVQEVKGRADLKNQNGEIEASAVTGDLVAKTSFARILVHDITGRAELHGQNSRIEARKIGGALVADSSFADLRAEDIGGSATLKCQNGKIDALRIGGLLTAANSFAPLRVEDIRGDAILDSQNGEISSRGVTGAVRAKTSFARMHLDGDGKRFEAKNQNGSVSITARSPAVERIAVTTSFAAIDVNLPRDCKPLIRATTSFGKVKSEFPVVTNNTMPEATFNADTALPKLTLHGQNGDIRVQALASR